MGIEFYVEFLFNSINFFVITWKEKWKPGGSQTPASECLTVHHISQHFITYPFRGRYTHWCVACHLSLISCFLKRVVDINFASFHKAFYLSKSSAMQISDSGTPRWAFSVYCLSLACDILLLQLLQWHGKRFQMPNDSTWAVMEPSSDSSERFGGCSGLNVSL